MNARKDVTKALAERNRKLEGDLAEVLASRLIRRVIPQSASDANRRESRAVARQLAATLLSKHGVSP